MKKGVAVFKPASIKRFNYCIRVKRKHAVDTTISNIEGNGERVSLLSTVVDFDPKTGEGKIDDGTGIATLILEDFLFAEKLTPGKRIRVIGRAYKSDDGVIIRAEIVHDMSDVDPSLYRKVVSLERRVWDESGI